MANRDSIYWKSMLAVLVFVFCVSLAGCGCNEESPTVTFVNNTSRIVQVHVEMSNGITLDLDDIQAGATSGEHVIPAGTTNLALVWGSIPVPYYTELQVEYCYDYEFDFTGETLTIVPHER